MKQNGKEHGIVRTVTPGLGLKESMCKDGKDHGFERYVKSNGEYRHSFWMNGKAYELTKFYRKDGKVIRTRMYEENTETPINGTKLTNNYSKVLRLSFFVTNSGA